MNDLKALVKSNRDGAAKAMVSVCTAQPDVLRASLMLARDLNEPILIEATSNQVNQFGGYTGLKPKDFITQIKDLMAETNTPDHLVCFGGDHLGPQAWRSEPAEQAMAKANAMMRAYVEAGFTKIHLDCSEGCAGEPAQLDDTLAATRAADLAKTCEAFAPDPDALVYIIGTEVPPPGGARSEEADHVITPTTPADAHKTVTVHKQLFGDKGLSAAWDRVVGLVVQPGLEFAPDHVDHFPMNLEDKLSDALKDWPQLAFEAHSTDYQHGEVFPELARRHFAFLKVGPALSFAYRQALYSLDAIRGWYEPSAPRLPDIMEKLMLADQRYWQNHYVGDAQRLKQLRHFGYADRIRYYWPIPEALNAVEALLTNLSQQAPLDPLLEQFIPPEIIVHAKLLMADGTPWPQAIVLSHIQSALRTYIF